MAMDITLEPQSAQLRIGDDYANENNIAFQIQLKGDEPVWLELQISVGKKGVLHTVPDANNIGVETPEAPDPKPSLVRSRDPDEENGVLGELVWTLGDPDGGIEVDGSAELRVAISNILCRAEAGPAQMTIIGKPDSGDEITAELDIEKVKPTTEPDNPILYFIAEPTNLIGQGEVTLSWDVADDSKKVILDAWRQPGLEPENSSYTQNLSETFTYTLKVESKQRQVTVNVMQEGWHDLYPLGERAFPSVLFDAGDRTKDALYAIFVRRSEAQGRQAVLCASANGITNWNVINEAIPDGMESSPGVQLGNRLWLIGGSAVDPEQRSNRICYYDLENRDKGWRDAVVTGFDDGVRTGHACVIINDDTIWVLGGLDQYQTGLNDVWSLTIPESDGELTANQVSPASAWEPRCMFSAVNSHNRIWVCGGMSSPNGIPLGDIWTTPAPPGNENWKELGRPPGFDSAIGTAMGGATGNDKDELFSVITTRRRENNSWLFEAGMSQLTQLTNTGPSWDVLDTVPQRPSEWTSVPHSIAAVAFQNRLYLRYLHRNAMYGESLVGAPLYVYVK